MGDGSRENDTANCARKSAGGALSNCVFFSCALKLHIVSTDPTKRPLCSYLVVLESAEPRVGQDQSVEHLVDHVRHAVDQVLRLRTASGCRGCVVGGIGGGRAGDERAARVEAECGGGGRAGYGAWDGERVTTAHVPEEQARSERTVHREEWQRERYCTSGVGEGIGLRAILG